MKILYILLQIKINQKKFFFLTFNKNYKLSGLSIKNNSILLIESNCSISDNLVIIQKDRYTKNLVVHLYDENLLNCNWIEDDAILNIKDKSKVQGLTILKNASINSGILTVDIDNRNY